MEDGNPYVHYQSGPAYGGGQGPYEHPAPGYSGPGAYPPPQQGGPGIGGQSQAGAGQAKRPHAIERFFTNPATRLFFRRNRHSLLATLVGIFIAVLILSIGFFQTLLIVLLGGLGFVIGSFFDRKSWIFMLLERLRRY